MINKKAKLLLVLLIVFILSGCYLFWVRHYDGENGFSILIPRSWEKEAGYENILFFVRSPTVGMEDRFRENINVSALKIPENLSLDTFFDVNKQQTMANFPGVKYGISDEDIFAGRFRGRMLIFSNKIESYNIKTLSAVWVRNGRAIIVTCTGEAKEFPKYEATFMKCVKSLRLK